MYMKDSRRLEIYKGYKIAISIISGLLCFFGASFSIQSGLPTAIIIAWGVLFLLLVALTWWEKNVPASEAEELIRANETKYRNVFENMHDLYMENALDGTITIVTPSVREILGYSAEELIGTNAADLYFSKGNRDQTLNALMGKKKLENYVIAMRHKNGQKRDLLLNLRLGKDGNGQTRLIGSARDVTEYLAAKAKQEETENELKLLKDNLETIIESTDDLVWSVDSDFRIVYSNSAMRNHMRSNYDTAYMPGMHTRDAFPPDLAEIWMRYYEHVLEKGRYQIEYKTVRGNKYLEVSLNPIYKDGEVKEISVFAKDITQRKRAEQEILKLNMDLEKRVAERTSELQTAVTELEAFTYTVSHDLKSPLRAIEAYSRILIEDYPQHAEDEIGEIVGNIKNISRDMIALINKLLQYSTTVRLDINNESVDISEMAGVIFSELTSALPERNIGFAVEPEFPWVRGDRVLLKQVLYNVISNAIKFTKTRDVAVISMGYTVEKDEVTVLINDNGVGFDSESSGKLFGIFQRLHPPEEYEGTGIGLATVRKIMQKHGGRAWIEGKPDQGATVYFTLPWSEQQ